MVVTGLEIGGIVVGCVNAGLGAAKLVVDWRNRRKERRKDEKNLKLEQSLRADAASIDTAYRQRLQQIQKHDRRRFEVGDELSLKEIKPFGQQLQRAMRELCDQMRKSKASTRVVVPDLARFQAASNSAKLSIVRALDRLHRRIVSENKISRSLNPLVRLGLTSKKNKLQKKTTAQDSGFHLLPASVETLSLPPPPSLPPSASPLPGIASSAATQVSNGLAAIPPTVWEIEAPSRHHHDHLSGCPHAIQSAQCTCNARPVIIVEKMYVKQSTKNTSRRKRQPRGQEMEVVLVRRPKK